MDGNASVEALYRADDFYLTRDVCAVPVALSNVKLNAVIDHIDNYKVAGKNGEKIDILTYLKSFTIKKNRMHEMDVKIPDISDSAKVQGIVVLERNNNFKC